MPNPIYLDEEESLMHIVLGSTIKIFSSLFELAGHVVLNIGRLFTKPAKIVMSVADTFGALGQEAQLAYEKYDYRWKYLTIGKSTNTIYVLIFSIATFILRMPEWLIKTAVLPVWAVGKFIKMIGGALLSIAKWFYDVGDSLTPYKAPMENENAVDELIDELYGKVIATPLPIIKAEHHLYIWVSFFLKLIGRFLEFPGRMIKNHARVLTKSGKILIDLGDGFAAPGREILQLGHKLWGYSHKDDSNVASSTISASLAVVAWVVGGVIRYIPEWTFKTPGYALWIIGKGIKGLGGIAELIFLGKFFAWGGLSLSPDPRAPLLDSGVKRNNLKGSLYQKFVRKDALTQHQIASKCRRAVATHRRYFEKLDLAPEQVRLMDEYDKALVRGTYLELTLRYYIGLGTKNAEEEERACDEYPKNLRKEFIPNVLPLSENNWGGLFRNDRNHFGSLYKHDMFNRIKTLQTPTVVLEESVAANKLSFDIEQADEKFMNKFLSPALNAAEGVQPRANNSRRRRPHRHREGNASMSETRSRVLNRAAAHSSSDHDHSQSRRDSSRSYSTPPRRSNNESNGGPSRYMDGQSTSRKVRSRNTRIAPIH